MDGFGIPRIHIAHDRQYVRFQCDNDGAGEKMTGDRQTREAVICFNFTKDKFLLLFTAIPAHLSLKQRNCSRRRMYAGAYLSDLHSLSLVVFRPDSETSGPRSFTLCSNLAFPARIWSAIVRSDNSQLWSRSASIILTCSPFDKAMESARKR